MKLLWLCSWYPNQLFPFNGDFIKRHAEAVSLFEEVTVVHVVRDEKGQLTKSSLINDSRNGNLREIIIYYYSPVKWPKKLEQLISVRKYLEIYGKVIEDYINLNGLPSLVHVHVGMNAGMIARRIKKKYRVPYVISEHWTGFLHEATDNFSKLSIIQQFLWLRVLKASAACSMVSEYLKVSMQKRFPFLKGEVIKNVVDTEVFFTSSSANETRNFIHISTLSDFKQPEMILHAFQIVVSVYPDAILEIFGPENNKIKDMVSRLNLQKNVLLFEEVPQKILAEYIRNAVALVLYSNYETFGCVIIEANACGVPVVVSDIPVFHEIVKEGINGYFAERQNVQDLANKMLLSMMERRNINKKAISELTHSLYSYQEVGKKITEWYRRILPEI